MPTLCSKLFLNTILRIKDDVGEAHLASDFSRNNAALASASTFCLQIGPSAH
jgi:hypothetical protein